MKKSLIIPFFILFVTFPAFAQLKLDLQESIKLATDSSLQSFRTKNVYLSNYWAYRSYKAARLPSITLITTPLEYNRDFVSRYDSEKDIDVYRKQQRLYSDAGLSLNQNFDLTGGTFFVDSKLGYIRSLGENTYTQFATVPIRVGYSQSLFGFNSFKWEKRIEPLKYEKAKKQFLSSREEISETVISYFFSLAMSRMEYNLAQDNVASSDTLYRIGTDRQQIMSISQSDLLTLKLDAVNARNSLKNAESGLKRNMFSFVSFLNLDKEIQVELILPERPVNLYVSVDEALEQARQNNPDFMTYQQEELEAEREVERTTKSSNFDASFYASIGFNQIGETLSGAYQNPLEQDIARIGFTIPLVDWGVRKGKVNMAKNNLNVAKISIEQKKTTLEQNVIMTVTDFNIQQDQINSAEEAVELATLAYNVTKDRFIIGKADLNSLTLSLNRLNTAQRNYISTLRDYWLNYYKLRRLTLYDFFKQEILSEQFDRIENIR